MTNAAQGAVQPTAAQQFSLYEQPLNERMRTFLRLEFLYKQLLYQTDQASAWASRGTVDSLLDIVSILSRGDVRGDVLKELERQFFALERLQNSQDINADRLHGIMQNLKTLRANLGAVGPKYLQELRDNEFLNSIRHRSSIPGGTCAFDIPEYTHWLRQNFDRRSGDTENWIEVVRPLCDAVAGLLWLVRNSKQPTRQIARNGVYLHSMTKDNASALIRISLAADAQLYPEVSGGQHRFSVRLMQWIEGRPRPEQTNKDVEFELTVC